MLFTVTNVNTKIHPVDNVQRQSVFTARYEMNLQLSFKLMLDFTGLKG
jgi:hypothetical protein